jgi:hypothetical protein
MNLKKLSAIIAIIIGLCTLSGLMYKYDQRLAKAADVSMSIQKLSTRLEQKIQDDRLNNIQERIWRLEDRYGKDPSLMPVDARDTYRRLCEEKNKIIRILEGMEK